MKRTEKINWEKTFSEGHFVALKRGKEVKGKEIEEEEEGQMQWYMWGLNSKQWPHELNRGGAR